MVTDTGKGSAASGPGVDAIDGIPETFGVITELARRLHQFESRALRESGLTPPQDGWSPVERTRGDLFVHAGNHDRNCRHARAKRYGGPLSQHRRSTLLWRDVWGVLL
jgi:hypothetical protein